MHLRHMNECRIFYDIQSITFFIIYLCNNDLRLIAIIPCISKSFQPFILPKVTSKPLLTAVKHDINAHAKPRLFDRNYEQR